MSRSVVSERAAARKTRTTASAGGAPRASVHDPFDTDFVRSVGRTTYAEYLLDGVPECAESRSDDWDEWYGRALEEMAKQWLPW